MKCEQTDNQGKLFRIGVKASRGKSIQSRNNSVWGNQMGAVAEVDHRPAVTERAALYSPITCGPKGRAVRHLANDHVHWYVLLRLSRSSVG